MLKTRLILAASVLALLSLSGCASRAQIDEQNKQLTAINISLTQIHAAQMESLAQQKVQTSTLVQSHNLQAAEAAQQMKRK